MTAAAFFVKTDKHRWRAEVAGCVVTVVRWVQGRSYTRRPGPFQKHRTTTSTTYAYAVVRRPDGQCVKLATVGSVAAAQAAGVRFARTGEGSVNDLGTKYIEPSEFN